VFWGEEMAKQRFNFTFEVTGTLELDDAVIDAVDDVWRSVFYALWTPEGHCKAHRIQSDPTSRVIELGWVGRSIR